MKKLFILSVIVIPLIFLVFTSAWSAGSTIVIGPGALPGWHANSQVQLGWNFYDPTNPQNSSPLPGWDKAIGDIPVWNYQADRIVWEQPGQWYIRIPNLINDNPIKHFWISWVYFFDPYTQGPRAFTNIDWNPGTGYGNYQQIEEWFDESGNPTTNHMVARYARITISLNLYPNPQYEDIWLGTKGVSMEALEVYVKTLCIDPCEGNFDGDSDVDGSDLATFAADFGRTNCSVQSTCPGDFDNDCDVDGSDLATFAADFGRTDCS